MPLTLLVTPRITCPSTHETISLIPAKRGVNDLAISNSSPEFDFRHSINLHSTFTPKPAIEVSRLRIANTGFTVRARSDPKCGVPRKTIPYVDLRIAEYRSFS